MPHVIVHFDPASVAQDTIGYLKMALQRIVADALSSYSATEPGHVTKPQEIFVRQFAVHPTDVNPAPIEVEINAGKSHGREAQNISDLVEAAVRMEPILPNSLLGPDGICYWTHFHENDGFTQSKPHQELPGQKP